MGSSLSWCLPFLLLALKTWLFCVMRSRKLGESNIVVIEFGYYSSFNSVGWVFLVSFVVAADL